MFYFTALSKETRGLLPPVRSRQKSGRKCDRTIETTLIFVCRGRTQMRADVSGDGYAVRFAFLIAHITPSAVLCAQEACRLPLERD